jgi:predicted MPP superfamily phosphohydrolase
MVELSKLSPEFNPEPGDALQTVEILHISDLHLNDKMGVDRLINPLRQDLTDRLRVGDLKYIVVTGDIAGKAEVEEYDKAVEFCSKLRKAFQIPTERLLLCPGNHDVSWDQGNKAYAEGRKMKITQRTLADKGLEVYWKRFENYSYFTEKATGSRYPIDPKEQAKIHTFEEDQLLFLSLNSSWKIDKRFKGRADINSDALAKALGRINNSSYDNWIKIVFFHHPVCFPVASNNNYKSKGWVEQLAGDGFTLMLTGHAHESTMLTAPQSNGKLHLIGVGTVGSGVGTRPESIPYQYNLLSLHLGTRMLRVRTRRKDSPEGSWWADARWGDDIYTSPRSEISLQL